MNLYLGMFKKSSAGDLLRLRWLVLLVSLISAALVEWSHYSINHDTSEFIEETLIYGIFTPSVIFALFTLLAYDMRRRVAGEERLALYQNFSQRLAQIRDWQELTTFLTRFPSLLLPIESCALYLYDHRNARYEFVADANAPNWQPGPLPACPTLRPQCQQCLAARQASVVNCALSTGHTPGDTWCLPLASNNLLVGKLWLKLQAGSAMSDEHQARFRELAPEIAVAIALAVSHPHEMARQRMVAQLEERRRLAGVLHNSLAQHIGLLHLSLGRLSHDQRLSDLPPVREELAQLTEASSEAYEMIRRLLALHRPDGLTSLPQTLMSYIQFASQRSQLHIDFASNGQPQPLPAQLGQYLLLLVQEGLNNIEKHAGASRVQLTLDWSERDLTLELVDDGVGFEPPSLQPTGHYGLAMIQEWADLSGGRLRLDSAPGSGTRLRLVVPYPPVQDLPVHYRLQDAGIPV